MVELDMENKPLNDKLQIRLALQTVFQSDGIINRAYFFVLVPFVSSLLLSLVSNVDNWQNALIIIIILGGLNILYQLFLWSVSFFYAQQIMNGDWTDYGLNLLELAADMGVKLRLALIRVFWYAPVILLGVVLAWHYSGAVSADGINASDLETNLAALAGIFAAAIWVVVVNNVFISLSNYLYSETGSIWQAVNLIRIFTSLTKSWEDYLVIIIMWVAGQILVLFLMIPLALISLVPFIGGLVLGFVLGLHTMYNTMFLANLQGQAWQKLSVEIS